MAMGHRTSTLPLPGAELDRLKDTLSRQYGSQVWEGAGERILVVRVPRADPDIIQDLETAVEHLAPADTDGITAALLVGDSKPIAVPIHPFMQLMAQRVRFDQEQCTQLRAQLAPGARHLYRAPGDPKKSLRLALRVAHASVQDVDDADMTAWAEALGADLAAGRLSGTRAVYLIANADHVRLDAALFFHDLRKQQAEAQARHDMAAQVAARQSQGKPKVERVAYAPLRTIEEDAAAAAVATATQSEPTPAMPQPQAESPTLLALAVRLRALGFDVLVRPAGHGIDLAAERADGDAQRVVAWTPERVTPDVATQALGTTRKLDIDLALMVCDDVEPEGRKRLIATKVRLLGTKDISNLDL